MIALSGAHRTGKSTLMHAFAVKNGYAPLQTNVTGYIREAGFDPAGAGKYDFATRLTIQEIVLKRLDELYATAPIDGKAITDRSPLDLLMYTYAEAIGNSVPEELMPRLNRYADDCYHVLNKRFSTVIVVQPGLPIVPEEGKAVPNPAFIEHLNSLVLGLTVGERLKVSHFYIPRRLTDLEDRIKAIDAAVNRVTAQAIERMADELQRGALVH